MADDAARKAENEARFRDANERQRAEAESIVNAMDELVPFLCECAQITCTSVLLVTLKEYEAVREVATDGLTAHGHEDPTIEDVVEKTDRFLRTRKRSAAGREFAERDPRS